MALKKWDPGFGFSGNKVTPDEIGWDMMYYIINPSINTTWFGTTAIGGTVAQKTLVLINALADYPRNLEFGVQGTNAIGGTWDVNGKDQFGNSISESGTIAVSGTAGGTTAGTKIFSEVTTGTFSFATGGSVGNGTPKLGVGTAGTTALFGLPAKLGGTFDVKMISGSFGGVGTSTSGTFIHGSAVAANVDMYNHAIKAPLDVQAGTTVYAIRYRPTYVVNDETVKTP
jgi:hypothetical protein